MNKLQELSCTGTNVVLINLKILKQLTKIVFLDGIFININALFLKYLEVYILNVNDINLDIPSLEHLKVIDDYCYKGT